MLSTFSILRTDLSLARSLGISKVLWTNGKSHQILHLLRVLPAICRRQIKFYNTKFQVAMSSLASHKAVVGLCRIFGQKVAFVSHFGKTVLLQRWLGVQPVELGVQLVYNCVYSLVYNCIGLCKTVLTHLGVSKQISAHANGGPAPHA